MYIYTHMYISLYIYIYIYICQAWARPPKAGGAAKATYITYTLIYVHIH